MRITVFLSLAIVLMMAFLVACGEAATPEPTATAAPTAEPTAVMEEPTAVTEEEPTAMMEEEPEDSMEGDAMMWEVSDELKAYAAEHAGGPGAIYIGDGNWQALVGPSVYDEFMGTYGTDLGDDAGQVPLDAILDLKWVFESGILSATA